MRKIAVAVALASTALSTPVLARDGAWYVGVEGGAMIVEDFEFDLADTDTTVLTTDSKYGWDADGIVGYDFGAFRLEAEAGYRRAGVDEHQTSVALAGIPAGNYEAGTIGRASALSFMLNGLIDFGADDGIQGFVGGGAGVARVKFEEYGIGSTVLLDDSDTVFAWQAIAGVRAPLSENVDVSFKYRFFNADDVQVVANTGAALDTRFRSHSVLGGLIFNFGEPTPPPPPPPPPPAAPAASSPPPPPAPEVCLHARTVHRVLRVGSLGHHAGSVEPSLDNAVSAYQSCGNAQVMLAGHADKSGAASYNVGPFAAPCGRSPLVSVGSRYSDGTISTEAFGEAAPRVDTADGVRELQNRRVEVTYGPGAGM